MLKAFKKLEKTFDEKELGMECMRLAQKLSTEGADPEKILCFGNRALKTLIETENQYSRRIGAAIETWSFVIASVLTVLGHACCQLRRFDEALSYLNWSNRNLCKLELDRSCPAQLVLPELLATQKLLFRVKVGLGRRGEYAVHLVKILEVKEKMLVEKDCMEIGKAYEDVSDAYLTVMKCKEALPYCLRAVEIYAKHLGEGSVEVAKLRRELGFIYKCLEEYEKAIEQNELAESALKGERSCGVVMFRPQLHNGDMLVHLGRYEEALDVLKGVVAHVADEGEVAIAFVFMAKALYGLEKFADAKKHMELALRLLDKKGMDPAIVAIGFGHMAILYEEMKDFETAISVVLRMLPLVKIPQEILREYSTRHAELIKRKEKEVEGQDEAFALLKLVKVKMGGFLEQFSASRPSPAPKYNEAFFVKNTESISSNYRKPSSSC